MSKNFSASLSMVSVQTVPNTPPLNKFGGQFENGWENFFSDLNSHLQQLQSVQQVGDIYVNRVGSVVTVTGKATKSVVNVGTSPAVGFENNGVHVDENGNVYADAEKAFSLSFIAKE